MFLQACLGLDIDAPNRQIRFVHLVLPDWLEKVFLRNVRVGDASLDLSLGHIPGDVGTNLIRRTGDASVVVIKLLNRWRPRA